MDKQHGNRFANTRRRPSGEHTSRWAQGNTQKDHKLENPCALMAYTDFVLKMSPPYTTDLLLK